MVTGEVYGWLSSLQLLSPPSSLSVSLPSSLSLPLPVPLPLGFCDEK